MTENQTKQLIVLREWMKSRVIVDVAPAVTPATGGKYACMIGATDSNGRYRLAHLGFSRSRSLCERIAAEQVAVLQAAQ